MWQSSVVIWQKCYYIFLDCFGVIGFPGLPRHKNVARNDVLLAMTVEVVMAVINYR